MSAVVEVVEARDCSGGVVDFVAASAALPKHLPVLHAGQGVFDPGPDFPVFGMALFLGFRWRQRRAG